MEPRPEAYERVVSIIEENRGSIISVPALAKLLGVKPTTLNAKFRREQVEVQTVRRTNYIPYELALRLVELHKYALFGWPTLQEASAITTVKDGTLKARCVRKENSRAYIDLTKRLRINPAALEKLQPHRAAKAPNGHGESSQPRPQTQLVPKNRRHAPGKVGGTLSTPNHLKTNGAQHETKPSYASPRNGFRDQVSFPSRPLPIRPVQEHHVELITRKSYGLSETEETCESKGQPAKTRVAVPERSVCLDYMPDQPFSITACSVGKVIYYGPYAGHHCQTHQ